MTTLTKDKIIAMSREAGISFQSHYEGYPLVARVVTDVHLEKFATLCRAPLVAEIEALKADWEQEREALYALAENERLTARLPDAPLWNGHNAEHRNKLAVDRYQENCALEAEIEALKDKNKTIEGWVANGELYQRMYDSGIEQEREIRQLEKERDELRSELATANADKHMLEDELRQVKKRKEEIRNERDMFHSKFVGAEHEIAALRSGGGEAVAHMNQNGVIHEAAQKYDDTLVPFVALMRKELHANVGKGDRPGWLKMSADTCLLEIYWHTAKLSAAVKNGDGDRIAEHSADVANMSMMLLDICGGINTETTSINYSEKQRKRCTYCDGTGDVHFLDGEWRGECTSCTTPQPSATEQEPVATLHCNDEGYVYAKVISKTRLNLDMTNPIPLYLHPQPSAAKQEPVAWIKHLIGAECKSNGQTYDLLFCPVDGYTPLYTHPQPSAVPVVTKLVEALEEIMEWQAKHVRVWNNAAYDNAVPAVATGQQWLKENT